MLTTKDIAAVYETILSTPGMNDIIKIDLKISRRNVLLLNSVIERGLITKEAGKQATNILDIVPEETIHELSSVSVDFLQRAGLTELSEKLNGLGTLK